MVNKIGYLTPETHPQLVSFFPDPKSKSKGPKLVSIYGQHSKVCDRAYYH